MNRFDADLLIVGSGPAGAQAAKEAIERGLSVVTIDVGTSDRALAESVPVKTFSELRRTDEAQSRYFIGDIDEDDIAGIKSGAHVTPPRRYVMRGARELLPLESASFAPVMSVAQGGLGSAWGAGCITFTRTECERAGLDFDVIRPLYDVVARDIGIAGDLAGDLAANMALFDELQPPVAVDDNASAIMLAYERRRAPLNARGFRLGRPPIAMLSRPLESGGIRREANALRDMEMYSDAGRSVYRPWYTIEALSNEPRYRYQSGMLALKFVQRDDCVELVCRDVAAGGYATFRASRLILAAGAINTGRLVLESFGAHGRRRPLLCNPYRYLPSVNLAMLGRAARDERHSLAQLHASLATRADDADQTFIAMYSYRALLTYRLIAEMPLPPQLGLLAARFLLSSLTVLGVHFPDFPSPDKWLALGPPRTDAPATLQAEYAISTDQRIALERGIRGVRAAMRTLGVLPLTLVDPGHGSSIHYAGPVPFSSIPAALTTAPDGRLHDASRVYIADSSTWRFLPSKGPTLTIMAQARSVARAAARDVQAQVG